MLYPRAVKWIPESGFVFNHPWHCVLQAKALPSVRPHEMHGDETNGCKIFQSEEEFVRDAGLHVAISGF